ncbi:hypothetical protein ACX9R5_05915 [Rathayibacter sp. CAU 1779]
MSHENPQVQPQRPEPQQFQQQAPAAQPAAAPQPPHSAAAPQPGAAPFAPGQQHAGRRTSVLGAWGARIVLIVVAACALVSVVFILFGTGGDTLGRVITTDVALILFALLVWLDTVIGAYRPEWFEFASLATDAYILLLWIVIIWTATGSSTDYSYYNRGAALALGIWLGLLSLLFIRGMLALVDLVRFLFSRWVTQVTRALAWVAACSFGVIAVMVTIPAPTPFNHLWDYDAYGRIVASIAVIGGVALVLIPLWGLLINRNNGERRVPAPYGYASGAAVPGASGYPADGYPAAATHGFAAAPVPTQPVSPQPIPAAAGAHPPLAWPRLADGRPVPVGSGGAPDFAAVAGASLAWPTHVDGSPVPAAADGTPLYR